MQTSPRTLILSVVGAAIVAALGYVSFRADPVPVDLATVVRGPMEITISADGHTKVRDLFEVASPIAGTALRSPVSVGDAVVGGQTVVAVVQPASSGLLDARTRLQAEASLQEAEAARHVAQADLQSAREELSFATSQFDRTKALVSRGVSTLTQLEDMHQRLAIAVSALEAAQARLDMTVGTIERAKASLFEADAPETARASCCVEIKAPADGVVLDIDQISQRLVAAGAPLLKIGDPRNLELVADVLSIDGVRLKPGAPAYVERWGGDSVLEARLDRIDPRAFTKVSALGIEEQRVEAFFSLLSPIAARPELGDEFAVFLRIVEWRAEDVLQVPLSAIFRDGESWAVFVVNDDVATLRPVQLGRRNTQVTEVVGGLEEGAWVVTHPNDALSDGGSVIERSSK